MPRLKRDPRRISAFGSAWLLAGGIGFSAYAQQTSPPAAAASAAMPARGATPPGAAASAAPTRAAPEAAQPGANSPPASLPGAPQRVEIQGGRTSDTDERRQSTAAKIVIGREEIERYGDSNTSEVLKRLPGVTIGGAPGRGGGPRMRGLGAGFTQILLNGERLPPGFTIDSITPEQIDRIEVLRSPTAETGARAIAGTINIITREGFTKRLNDLKLGFETSRGRVSPGLFWTRNDSVGQGVIYTTSVALFRRNNEIVSTSTTLAQDLSTGAVIDRYDDQSTSVNQGQGFNVNARLQFRFGEGHALVLMPIVILNDSKNRSLATRDTREDAGSDCRAVPNPCTPAYATSAGSTEGRFTMLRLNTQYNRLLDGGARMDLRMNGGVHRWSGETTTQQFDEGGTLLRTIDNDVRWRDNNVSLNGKVTRLFADNHNFVSGVEVESNQREESRVTLVNGASPTVLDDFGDNVKASSRRAAIYLQDEWNVTPQWAAHAGLRWEGIQTRGSGVDGSTIRNRSSVATPLLHAVYKFDPKRRDQLRMSLTRSYRTPTLAQLIARPNIALNNSLTSPDRYGNPALKPELATGIDMALERFLSDGGVLSANLFRRNLSDVIRNVVTENAANGRVESRPQNVGDATTTGLELEAKFRLDQVMAAAPRIDLRWNASVFDSKVERVPGPHNRLESQARGAINLGADYRFRGTPWSLGGNLNWTPSVTTRLSESQVARESAKLVGDAYALWVFDPNLQLRVTASNFAPRDYDTSNQVVGSGRVQTTDNSDKTRMNLNVRLEIKL